MGVGGRGWRRSQIIRRHEAWSSVNLSILSVCEGLSQSFLFIYFITFNLSNSLSGHVSVCLSSCSCLLYSLLPTPFLLPVYLPGCWNLSVCSKCLPEASVYRVQTFSSIYNIHALLSWTCTTVCLSVLVCHYQSICVARFPSDSLLVYLSICLSVCLHVCVSFCLSSSICLFISECLAGWLCVCLSVCFPVYVFPVCLYLSTCLITWGSSVQTFSYINSFSDYFLNLYHCLYVCLSPSVYWVICLYSCRLSVCVQYVCTWDSSVLPSPQHISLSVSACVSVSNCLILLSLFLPSVCLPVSVYTCLITRISSVQTFFIHHLLFRLFSKPISLPAFMCACLQLSIVSSVCIPAVCQCVCVYLRFLCSAISSVHLTVCLHVCLSVCLPVYLSNLLSTSHCLSVSICILGHLSVCLSVCLPVYLGFLCSDLLSPLLHLSVCLSVY